MVSVNGFARSFPVSLALSAEIRLAEQIIRVY
jgi:hypothetical protein